MAYAGDMSQPNRTLLRSLTLRLQAQTAELATCTTAAMTRCVAESIADTERQLAEARG